MENLPAHTHAEMQGSSQELSTPVADNAYVKSYIRKDSFVYAENDDGSRVRYPSDVKLAGVRSQAEISRRFNLTEKL